MNSKKGVSVDRPEKVVFLVTGNVHKYIEARLVLAECGLSTAMINVDTIEIQANTIESVAKASAIDAVKKCCLPLIVEDSGLFVETLNGFPGPYSSYAFETVGTGGILGMMRDVKNRRASFQSVIAFATPRQKSLRLFHGRVEGRIAEKVKGKKGFGFDPIFIPKGVKGKTFAEMSVGEKNKHSHRAKALRAFAEWYCSGSKNILATCLCKRHVCV
jgi:XTP/dITP diphosphohydrolase